MIHLTEVNTLEIKELYETKNETAQPTKQDLFDPV